MNIKKKLLIIVLSFVIAFSLIGCKAETVQVNVSNNENLHSSQFKNFVEIADDLYYDSATRIIYFKCYTGYGYAFVPYYAPNGLPYRYNAETNTFEEIVN